MRQKVQEEEVVTSLVYAQICHNGASMIIHIAIIIPSEARFLLGTPPRSYGFKVYVANLKKVVLAHYSHSGSLAGSNIVNSCYFSSSRLASSGSSATELLHST